MENGDKREQGQLTGERNSVTIFFLFLSPFLGHRKAPLKADEDGAWWPHKMHFLWASWLQAVEASDVSLVVPFLGVDAFKHVLWECIMLVANLGLHGIYDLFLFLAVALDD